MSKVGKFSRPRSAPPEPAEAPKPKPEPKPEPAPKPKAEPKPKKKPAPPPEPIGPEEEELTPIQRFFEIVKDIFTGLVMLAAVAMVVFTVFSMQTFDRNDRDIFGYKAFIVRSDSMSATDFSAGDLVIVQEVDPATLAVGDIISFLSEDPSTLGETFTHKIRSKTTNDRGLPAFVTYGTTTGVDDAYPVSYGSVLGVYLFSIPKMGTVMAFMKTPVGYLCCILAPILLMLVIQGASSVKAARQIYKDKQDEQEAQHQRKLSEMEAHVQAMEAQRVQMEAMLAEMKRIQEQLANQPPKDSV